MSTIKVTNLKHETSSSDNITLDSSANTTIGGNLIAQAGSASTPAIQATGDSNTGIYFPAADNIGFTTGGTIRGRWTTDGLCFNADTATDNALDDYEKGTWTPVFRYFSGGVWNNVAFSNTPDHATGSYVKIGDMVYFSYYSGNFTISTGNGNKANITGLPYDAYNDSSTYSGALFYHTTCFDSTIYSGSIDVADTSISPIIGNGTTQPNWNASSGNKYLMISGTYRTT